MVCRSAWVPRGRRTAMGPRSSKFALAFRTRPDGATTCTMASSSPGTAGCGGRLSCCTAAATSSARAKVARSTSSTSERRSTNRHMIALTASAIATTRHAAIVVRARMVPTRLNSRLATVGVETVADVDLDDVEVAVERVVPHVLQDLRLRDDVTSAPHQILEERELARRERDLGVATPAAVLRGIKTKVTRREDGRPLAAAAPDEGTQVGEQHHVAERLGEEVVRSRVERLGVVELAFLRREHQDRRPDVRVAQRGAHLEAVLPGKHDV